MTNREYANKRCKIWYLKCVGISLILIGLALIAESVSIQEIYKQGAALEQSFVTDFQEQYGDSDNSNSAATVPQSQSQEVQP